MRRPPLCDYRRCRESECGPSNLIVGTAISPSSERETMMQLPRWAAMIAAAWFACKAAIT